MIENGNTLEGTTPHFTSFGILVTEPQQQDSGDGFDMALIAAIVVPTVFGIAALILLIIIGVLIGIALVHRYKNLLKSNIVNYEQETEGL